MGRKRKPIHLVKVSKSIRITPTLWNEIHKEKERLGHEYWTTTIEHILRKYFNK